MNEPDYRSFTVGRADGEPVFRPFLGSTYSRRLQAQETGELVGGELERVHLLGESHYVTDDYLERRPIADLTCDVIGEFRDGGSATLTKMLMAAEGKAATELEGTAWDRYAFSNFVQRPMAHADDRPTDADWEQASRLFFAQLASTRPTVLAVFGHQMWDKLPISGGKLGPVPATDVGDEIDDLWLYPFEWTGGKHLTIAVKLPHPRSRGLFDPQIAHRRINAARYFYSNICASYGATGS